MNGATPVIIGDGDTVGFLKGLKKNKWDVIIGVVVAVVAIMIISTTMVVEPRCSSWNPYSPPYKYIQDTPVPDCLWDKFLIVFGIMLGLVLAIFPELMRKKLL
jgi:hypothetical protein